MAGCMNMSAGPTLPSWAGGLFFSILDSLSSLRHTLFATAHGLGDMIKLLVVLAFQAALLINHWRNGMTAASAGATGRRRAAELLLPIPGHAVDGHHGPLRTSGN